MQTSQINARMESELKREGDAVIARHGSSTTTVIRELWSYLARTGTLPDFMDVGKNAHKADEAPEAAFEDGAGLALALAKEQGLIFDIPDMSYDDLKELAFQESQLEVN